MARNKPQKTAFTKRTENAKGHILDIVHLQKLETHQVLLIRQISEVCIVMNCFSCSLVTSVTSLVFQPTDRHVDPNRNK